MTLFFAAALIVIVLATFLTMRLISASVLRATARKYLLESVNANADEVLYIRSMAQARDTIGGDIFIEYDGGYLEIDDDFLDIINDVHTALYTGDGTLLYGTNPLARQMDGQAFADNAMRRLRVNGIQYEIYERKMTIEGTDALWLRGVMPMTAQNEQLRDITRVASVLLPALILLAVIVSYLLTGRMLTPLRNIERTAAEISGGTDLKRRIALEGPDDEVHRLADTFDEMVERLDASFETERRFTSDASHELRTPMSVIMAQCEYTLDKERTTREYEDALRTIRRQGARMNGLINDMLDYTRMEQKAENYPLTVLDFSELVRGICADMAMLKTNEITLYARVPDDIYVNGNKMLLTRMLQNLISNAYRYGNENGMIEVRLTGGQKVTLEVEDNGIGIAEEHLPFLFDRFYRAESSRSQKGTGLGLSMVQRIAELHGAGIQVKSAPGEGTTFTVTFPAAAGPGGVRN